MNGEWSSEAITGLRALWGAGVTSSEIGRQLGYSKGAIIGKAHRLKLPQREGLRLNGGRPKKTPISSPDGHVVTAARKSPSPPYVQPVFRGVTVHKPEKLPPPVLAYVPPLRVCQWPIGEPGKPGFKFCGAKAAEGKPYCDEHCKKAYMKRER